MMMPTMMMKGVLYKIRQKKEKVQMMFGLHGWMLKMKALLNYVSLQNWHP